MAIASAALFLASMDKSVMSASSLGLANVAASGWDNRPVSGGKGDLAGKRRATVARAAARRRRRPMERASRRGNRGR